MKLIASLSLLLLSASSFAQVYFTALPSGKPQHTQTRSGARIEAEEMDTITLPFFDDFSASTEINENRWLCEGGVLINNTYPVNPPSLNVGTFDGISETGEPYEFVPNGTNPNTDVDGLADHLTSQAIDLSPFSASDNVALSFYWQMGGVDENLAPDFFADGDYLKVELKDSSGIWNTVWPVTGDDTSSLVLAEIGGPFTYSFVEINSDIYFHEGFQMRFQSRGKITGNWDIWNLDYIYLDSGRVTDEFIVDLSYSEIPTSILKDYTAMPTKQFLNDIAGNLADTVFTYFTNQTSAITDQPTIVVKNGEFLETERGIAIDDVESVGVTNGLFLRDTTIKVGWIPDASAIEAHKSQLSDGSNIRLKYTFDMTTSDDYEDNDSVGGVTVLSNYYAYDDGSAEVGFGISGYGEIAQEFTLDLPDTLSYISIYFPKIGIDFENSSYTLKVWTELEGVNGGSENVVVAVVPFFVQYSIDTPSTDQFVHVNMDNISLPAGTFYIGYEQNLSNRLLVGFDKNTNHITKIYSNVTNAWTQNFVATTTGSLMIRPVFGDPAVGIKAKIDQSLNAYFFPNPANDEILINGPVEHLSIVDMMGRAIEDHSFGAWEEKRVPISHLDEGAYIIKMEGDNRQRSMPLMISR